MFQTPPLEPGDLRPLTWGSVRWSVARAMRLVADEGYRSTGIVPAQYVALICGEPTTLTAEQVRAFVPSSQRPSEDELDAHELWTLTGDDGLSPTG